jgi:hypothetical protein
MGDREVRFEGLSLEALGKQLEPLALETAALKTRAMVFLALAAALAFVGYRFGLRLHLDTVFRERFGLFSGVADALEAVTVFGPAAGFAFAWWRTGEKTASTLAGLTTPALVKELGARVSGPLSLSASWGGERTGPFERVRLAVWGTRTSGTPFLLGVEEHTTRSTSTRFVASGVGVSARRRTTTHRHVTVFLELGPGAARPTSDTRFTVRNDGAAVVVSRDLGPNDATVGELLELLDLVA